MSDRRGDRKHSVAWAATLAGALTAATIAGGVWGDRLLGSPVQDEFHQRLQEYTQIVEAASEWAPKELPNERLVFASIDGMLRTLDPHSSFLAPRDYAEMQERQKGSFYGLGILVTRRNERVTVITPLEGTPAARLGIRAGDVIAEVEGENTDDLTLDEVVSRLKGPKGTTVNIKIKRPGIEELIPLSIVREAIPTNSISHAFMLQPEVGYVRIKDFTYTTVREFDEAVDKLETQGMKKLILDLRTNPGGLLDAAVGISDYFIPQGGMIVYTKGRTADANQEFRAPGKHAQLDVPVIVLINRGSASASEIVAGAIQDHDRGLVLGQTSWGKGLVQSVYTLNYGAGLALTTSKYFTPAGRNIQRDYTSFYDYYVANTEEPDEETPLSEREVFYTDSGRKVYGGGGITPDVFVEADELDPITQILEVRSVLFNFGVDYYSRHPEVTREVKVDQQLLDEFVRFAVSKSAASEAEIREVLQNEVDREYLTNAIRAEIVAAKYGYDASYPIRLQSDDFVAKAVELFPRAEELAEVGEKAREERLASNDSNRDAQRASNERERSN